MNDWHDQLQHAQQRLHEQQQQHAHHDEFGFDDDPSHRPQAIDGTGNHAQQLQEHVDRITQENLHPARDDDPVHPQDDVSPQPAERPIHQRLGLAPPKTLPERLFQLVKAYPGIGLADAAEKMGRSTVNLAGTFLDLIDYKALRRERAVTHGRKSYVYFAIIDDYRTPDPSSYLDKARATKAEKERRAKREAARLEAERKARFVERGRKGAEGRWAKAKAKSKPATVKTPKAKPVNIDAVHQQPRRALTSERTPLGFVDDIVENLTLGQLRELHRRLGKLLGGV